MMRHLDNDLVWCLLLFRLVEDVDGPSGLIGNIRNVESSSLLLSNLLDLLEILLGQFNLLEVLLDARGGNRLGNDRVTAHLSPGENNLCRGSANSAGNFLDGIVLNEKRNTEHVVTECLELGLVLFE